MRIYMLFLNASRAIFFDSNVNDINLNKFIALCRNKHLDFGSAMGIVFNLCTTKLSDMHTLAMTESV